MIPNDGTLPCWYSPPEPPAPPAPHPSSVLAEASEIVAGARRASYGRPIDNHQRTANLWNAYLAVLPGESPQPLTPRDVCMLNILQKISRDRFQPKRDNLVDIAGYAENAQLCETPGREESPTSATGVDQPDKC